jgi:WD40 repeat protein
MRPTPTYFLSDPIRMLSFDAGESRLATNETVWRIERGAAGHVLSRLFVADSAVLAELGIRPSVKYANDPDYVSDPDILTAPGSGDQIWAFESPVAKDGHYGGLWRLAPTKEEWRLPIPENLAFEEVAKRFLLVDDGLDMESLLPTPGKLAVSPDGANLVMTVGASVERKDATGAHSIPDIFLEYWNIEKRQFRTRWPGEHRPNGVLHYGLDLAFSPDGGKLVIVGPPPPSAPFEIVDLASGRSTPLGAEFAHRAEFSPDSRFLLAISNASSATEKAPAEPGTITLFDLERSAELQSWPTPPQSWSVVALGTGARLAAHGEKDGEIHLWDVKGKREIAAWPAHERAVTAMRFSKDGATLYSGGADGAIKLWNLPFIRQELAKLGLAWHESE